MSKFIEFKHGKCGERTALLRRDNIVAAFLRPNKHGSSKAGVVEVAISIPGDSPVELEFSFGTEKELVTAYLSIKAQLDECDPTPVQHGAVSAAIRRWEVEKACDVYDIDVINLGKDQKREEADYLTGHRLSGIKVGDMVNISSSRAESYSRGWCNGWTEDMDEFLSSCAKVVSDDGPAGFGLTINDEDVYFFPYFVLEHITEGRRDKRSRIHLKCPSCARQEVFESIGWLNTRPEFDSDMRIKPANSVLYECLKCGTLQRNKQYKVHKNRRRAKE